MAGGNPEATLSLLSKSAVVADFKRLVLDRLGETDKNSSTNQSKSTLSTALGVAELGRELYDKALSLPEAKSVSLQYTDNKSKHQYGNFTGTNSYVRDSSGNWVVETVGQTPKQVKSGSGWIILRPYAPDYPLFSNEATGDAFTINIHDFEPTSTVADFEPLYTKLKEAKFSGDESIADDTLTETSQATTHREEASDEINKDSDYEDAIASNNNHKTSTEIAESLPPYVWQHLHFGGMVPKQISVDTSKAEFDSVYNNVQAVIYDIPTYTSDNAADQTLDQSATQLFCYQQPESISYTSSAQFDAQSPRGSQQPFQFYVANNAMELSFELKWHIDEIRTFLNEATGSSYSIQDIAEIAENFTRPWTTGTSVHPKLCHVILPGISHIGYITSANITYSGAMSGDYITGPGVLGGDGSTIVPHTITNYFYSQISVSFSMVIVKDVKLFPANSQGLQIKIEAEDSSNENDSTQEANQENKAEDSSKPDDMTTEEAEDTTNNSLSASESPSETAEQEVVQTFNSEATVPAETTQTSSSKKSSKSKKKSSSKKTTTPPEEYYDPTTAVCQSVPYSQDYSSTNSSGNVSYSSSSINYSSMSSNQSTSKNYSSSSSSLNYTPV